MAVSGEVVGLGRPGRGARARRILRLAVAGILVALSVIYLVAGIYMNLLVVGPGLANRSGSRVGADFSAFYTVARQVWAGDPQRMYDEAAFRSAHEAVLDVEVGPYPWSYPPTFFFLVAPMALLPPVASFWTWTSALILLVVLMLHRRLPGWLPAAVFLSPGVTHAAICNPTGVLTAALFALGLALLFSAPVAAGLCFALATYKPHLAMLIVPCLVAGGHRRALASMMAGTAVLALAAVTVFGIDAWVAFVRAVPRILDLTIAGGLPIERMPTVYASILAAGGDPAVAGAAQTATTALATVTLWYVWRRSRHLAIRALALGAAIPLATPYGYDYDMAFLVVPAVLLAADARRADRIAGAWLPALIWVSPVVPPLVAQSLGYHVGPAVLGILLVSAARLARSTAGAPSGPCSRRPAGDVLHDRTTIGERESMRNGDEP